MALEDLVGAGKYIAALDSSNPAFDDFRSEGDAHLRGIKNVLKLSFPAIAGAMTSNQTELNLMVGATVDSFVGKLALAGAVSGDITIDLDVYDRIYFADVTGTINITFANAAGGSKFDMVVNSPSTAVVINYINATGSHYPILTSVGSRHFATGIFTTANNIIDAGVHL